jgi:WD40 repeat protein
MKVSADCTLKIWDLGHGAVLATLKGHGAWVRVVAVTPDGRRAVSGCYDRTLKVWDLEQGALLSTL